MDGMKWHKVASRNQIKSRRVEVFVAEGSDLREPLAVGSKNDAPTVRMDAETPTKARVRPVNRTEW